MCRDADDDELALLKWTMRAERDEEAWMRMLAVHMVVDINMSCKKVARELGRELNVELKAGQVEEWVDLWEERGVNALKGKRQGKRKRRSARSPGSGPA